MFSSSLHSYFILLFSFQNLFYCCFYFLIYIIIIFSFLNSFNIIFKKEENISFLFFLILIGLPPFPLFLLKWIFIFFIIQKTFFLSLFFIFLILFSLFFYFRIISKLISFLPPKNLKQKIFIFLTFFLWNLVFLIFFSNKLIFKLLIFKIKNFYFSFSVQSTFFFQKNRNKKNFFTLFFWFFYNYLIPYSFNCTNSIKKLLFFIKKKRLFRSRVFYNWANPTKIFSTIYFFTFNFYCFWYRDFIYF